MAEPTYKKVDNYYYDPAKPLGKGAFATVYKATEEKTGAVVAVKVISAVKLLENEDQYNLFMREINVLREIRGEHIVRLLDVKRTTNNLYIFTDYCDGGDLEKKLKAKHQFTEEEACTILKQIADAFYTLENLQIVNTKGHKAIIMHRDIKAANILFHQGRIKVADFGFAKLVDEVDKNTRKAHTLLGTPLYMAPQILNDENYSAKCDIWSTGVLFYEILFGKLPWTGHSVPNLYSNIKSKPLTFPKTISNETKDLVTRMLKMKEDERLSWKEVYEHPAMKKINIKVEPKEQVLNQQPQTQPQNLQQQQQQQQQTQPIPQNQNQQQQQGQGQGQQQFPSQNLQQNQQQNLQQYPQQYPQQQGSIQKPNQQIPQQSYPNYPQQQQQQQGGSMQKSNQQGQQQGYPYPPQQQQQQGFPQQQQGGYPQQLNPGPQNYPQQPGFGYGYPQQQGFPMQPGYGYGGFPQQGYPQQPYGGQGGYNQQPYIPPQNQNQNYPQFNQNQQGKKF